MIFTANNLITTSNATVNNPSTSYPAANMINDRLVEVTQFDQTIVIDLGAAVAVDTLCCAGFTVADLEIEANSSDVWASPPFTQAMDEIDSSGVALAFINQTYRYWRLTSASTAAQIGYFYIGSRLVFPDPQYGAIPDYIDNSIISQSINGQRYVTDGVILREQEFSFNNVSYDMYTRIRDYWTASGRRKCGVFAQTEEDMTLFEPYFAQLELRFDGRSRAQRYNFNMTVREGK